MSANKANGAKADGEKPTPIKVDDQDEWDEERLEEGLRRLKLLHIKSRKLRQTIPHIVEPLYKIQQSPSPVATFQVFKQSIDDARGNVVEFTELMRDEKSKAVLDRAEKSRADNPIGIKPWKHKDHPDWFDLDENAK